MDQGVLGSPVAGDPQDIGWRSTLNPVLNEMRHYQLTYGNMANTVPCPMEPSCPAWLTRFKSPGGSQIHAVA